MASRNSQTQKPARGQRRLSYEGNPLLADVNSHYITFDNSPHGAYDKDGHTRAEKLKCYLTADVNTRWADLILIICFAISGLIDSGAYNAYECFVSMMTGNTVFAALGVSNLPLNAPRYAWTKSVCSIIAFLFGAGLISAFHRTFGERKRWVLAMSFAVQAAFIAISAHMVARGFTSDSPAKKPSLLGLPSDPGFPWADLIPISLLSFQAAGKVVASRALQYNALPTVVLTTLYNDLMSDPGLLTSGLLDNVQRNRRLGGLIFYFGGAVAGGAFSRSSLGFSGLLWTAAAVKLVIVLSWLVWREDAGKEEDEG